MNNTINSLKQLWKYSLALIWLPAGVILLDQLTKSLVRAKLSLGETWEPIPALAGVFRILNIDNPAAAFGLLGEDSSTLLTILGIVLIAGMVFFLPRIARSEAYIRLACGFLLGGFTGNTIDRLLQGYVTDIISVLIPNVFNLADIANFAGFAILLIGYLEEDKPKETETTA